MLGRFGVTGAAIIGAGLTLLLARAFALRVGNPVTVLIVGVMFAYFAGALVDVLTYYADPERLKGLAQFSPGTVRDVSWDELAIVAPVCIGVVLLSMLLSTPLNLLLLGERYAASMGVNVRRVQFLSLSSVAVLAGVTTAFCGAIGFCRARCTPPRAGRPTHLGPPRRAPGQCAAGGGHRARRRVRRRRQRPDRGLAAVELGDGVHRRPGRPVGAAAPAPRFEPGADVTAPAGALVMDAADLTVGYMHRRSRIAIIDHVDLELRAGELVCLLGPNGIGKSTLLRTHRDAAVVVGTDRGLGGANLGPSNARELARHLSVVLTDRVERASSTSAGDRRARPQTALGWFGRLTRADEDSVDWAIDAVGAAHSRPMATSCPTASANE